MFFNIDKIRNSVGEFHLLTSAELRMLIKSPSIDKEQRVELYYVSGGSFRYHASRFVTNSIKDKWLSFDVTEPLQQWLKDNGETAILTNPCFVFRFSTGSAKGFLQHICFPESEQKFELRVFCECDQQGPSRLLFSVSGISEKRGDQAAIEMMTEQPPYILTMSIPKNMSSPTTSRKKRSTSGPETCTS